MKRRLVHRQVGLCVALLVASLLYACSKQTPEELVVAAQRHMAENNFRAAQIELRNAVRLAPNNGTAQRMLAATLLRTGDPDVAESILRKSMSLGEKADDVVPMLALAMLRQGQSQRLIGEFGNAHLQDPAADADLRASLGQAWLMRGEARQAAESFAAALAVRPDHARAQLGQARIAADEGRMDDALAMTDRALKADPRLEEGHAFRSQILLARGERVPAIESLERALAIDATYLTARLALATILIESRDYDKAKAVLSVAEASAKDSRLNFLRGLLALRQGDLPKAKDQLAAVLRINPDHGPALLLAGEIELRLSNLNLAEQHLGKAANVQPTPMGQRLLAATYLRQNRPGKAVEALQPLLRESGPKDANLMMLAGEAYLANGDVRRAAEFFEASKSTGPTAAAARTRLGQIAVSRGDFERGAEELQAASTLTQDKIEPDLLLVTLHLQRREPTKALAAAQAFIKKQPQNPVGYVLAATAQIAGHDRAGARQSLEVAIKLKPDYVPAIRGLTDLDIVEGRTSEAQRRYESLLAKQTGDEQLLIAAAEMQERTGRVEEAGKTLRMAISANPQSPAAYAALVRYHLRHKNAAAALAVAKEAVDRNPEQLSLVELLGITQDAAGADRDAIRTLKSLVVREPNALKPLISLAQVQARQRDFDGAARTLTRAQEKAPEDEAVARDLVGVYLQGGKPEQALKVAKDLQVRRPLDAVGYVLEGDVRAFAKKWPDAERAYRAALKADPRSGVAAVKIYGVLVVSGRKKDSAEFVSEWTARNPADVSLRMVAGEQALQAKDYAGAVQQYDAALRNDPNNVVILNNLAWSLGQLNDPRAIGVAERAVELAPNSSSVLDTLGMLHLRGGDANKGVDLLARVRHLEPERLDLRLHYAMGLLQTGRTHEGKAELRELAAATADFPGKTDIPALLAKP